LRSTPTPGPVLWVVERNDARVYLFGFGEAKDRSWLSPAIEQAFAESAEVWFEVPPANPSAGMSPVVQELGYARDRNLFDVLGPELAARTMSAAAELGIARERLEPMRPWLAREVIQRAYAASGRSANVETEYADGVLRERAAAAGKVIRHEFDSIDAVLRLFGGMNDEAQRQYLVNMLDYIDDAKNGLHVAHYGWLDGAPSLHSLDRMRTNSPALYQAMHPERNLEWATHVEQMLDRGGVYLVVVGLNHTLGPDSIQEVLRKRGLPVRRK
jgi:uncharacterized protein YbaP (TraB family)